MHITTATTDEQSVGISAWLRIPRRSFEKARRLQVPDRLERNILHAVNDAKADTVAIGVPLNKGEAMILRNAGIPVA